MQAARGAEVNGSAREDVLLVALELSAKSWTLMFGDGSRRRRWVVPASDWIGFDSAVEQARARFGLGAGTRVVSCYEAGRDGFWIHRALQSRGIENVVVDSASLEVKRRSRRVKTDRLDAEQLLEQLRRWWGGERRALTVVRVPEAAAEDARWLHRRLEHARGQRTRESNRIRSLLATQGVVLVRMNDAKPERLMGRKDGSGQALGEGFVAMLSAAWSAYEHFDKEVRAIEAEQLQQIQAHAQGGEGPYALMRLVMSLKGIGNKGAWLLVRELLGWRRYRNRRELAASVGLAPSPYDSGQSRREQGISKAGNRRVRALMIELSWSWLRHQRQSALAQWFDQHFGAGKRSRKVGIVALARRLLIALWRMTMTGEVPQGAVFKPVEG